GVASAATEIVIEPGLIVPVAQLHVEPGDRRQDQPGVAVAAGEAQGAATGAEARGLGLASGSTFEGFGLADAGGVARAIEGDLEQRAGVGQAQVDLAVEAIAGARARAALDDPAREATEPNRDAAGV